jgi:hypothetical protein
MRTKLKITEGIFPMPVLMVATYNEDGSVNVMNAAWGTMQERDTVVLNLTETHKTVQNIKARGAFTVSIADAAHIVEADYFGVESGNKVADKFARSGLSSTSSRFVWSAGSSSIRTMNTDAASSAKWSMSLPMRALWWMEKLICLGSTPSHLTPTPTAIIKSPSVWAKRSEMA